VKSRFIVTAPKIGSESVHSGLARVLNRALLHGFDRFSCSSAGASFWQNGRSQPRGHSSGFLPVFLGSYPPVRLISFILPGDITLLDCVGFGRI
jgi:hypothetical protein